MPRQLHRLTMQKECISLASFPLHLGAKIMTGFFRTNDVGVKHDCWWRYTRLLREVVQLMYALHTVAVWSCTIDAGDTYNWCSRYTQLMSALYTIVVRSCTVDIRAMHRWAWLYARLLKEVYPMGSAGDWKTLIFKEIFGIKRWFATGSGPHHLPSTPSGLARNALKKSQK